MDVGMESTKMMNDNYPESLRRVIIINGNVFCYQVPA